jgi:hypothetical protein
MRQYLQGVPSLAETAARARKHQTQLARALPHTTDERLILLLLMLLLLLLLLLRALL